jgi:tellurite resistance protein
MFGGAAKPGTGMINHHDALIYIMVLASAADQNMSDAELRTIGEMVNFLPIFRDFDNGRLPDVARACAQLLLDEHGLDKALNIIKDELPPQLRETAYALACDVMAADGGVSQEELRLLELVRDRLQIDNLVAAAIERAARARHLALDGSPA